MSINKKALLEILSSLLLIFVLSFFAQSVRASVASDFLQTIQDALVGISVIMAVIGFCIAGYLYLTSGGSSEKMTVAKRAIIAAVIGIALLVLAESAQDIVKSFLT